MRLATTVLGTTLGTIAILYILWIYAVGTFITSADTDIVLAADLRKLTYLVLGAAILQILAAGLAWELPWGAFLAAIPAAAGYVVAAIDGPEVFMAWAVSAGLMVAMMWVEIYRGTEPGRRYAAMQKQGLPPSWWLEEDEEA